MIKAFSVVTKPIGPICNIDCKYCFYLEKEKLYPEEKRWAMPENVLESYVRQYIEVQDINSINFIWQGGEPTLLGLNYFKKVIEFQNKYSNGKKIGNAFQTNGILLNDEWCEFFVKNNFLIGLSIDGPQHLNDKYRTNKMGRSSFEAAVRGIGFLKKHNVEFNTLTVVSRANSYYALEVYNFLKEIGNGFMQFIPVVEKRPLHEDTNNNSIPININPSLMVTEWSVEPFQFGKFLCEIFDEWVRKDVGKYFVQNFDVALERWYGVPSSVCIFAEKCGTALAIEHNGDLYSCDHYVFPDHRLGNIKQHPLDLLVYSAQQIKFGEDKKDTLPNYCKQCKVKFACNGECPKNRFISAPNGEPGLNYLCEGYKHFFNYIDLYMHFMANELRLQRPPANVMNWVKEKHSYKYF